MMLFCGVGRNSASSSSSSLQSAFLVGRLWTALVLLLALLSLGSVTASRNPEDGVSNDSSDNTSPPLLLCIVRNLFRLPFHRNHPRNTNLWIASRNHSESWMATTHSQFTAADTAPFFANAAQDYCNKDHYSSWDIISPSFSLWIADIMRLVSSCRSNSQTMLFVVLLLLLALLSVRTESFRLWFTAPKQLIPSSSPSHQPSRRGRGREHRQHGHEGHQEHENEKQEVDDSNCPHHHHPVQSRSWLPWRDRNGTTAIEAVENHDDDEKGDSGAAADEGISWREWGLLKLIWNSKNNIFDVMNDMDSSNGVDSTPITTSDLTNSTIPSALSSSLGLFRETMEWWEDLAPPFRMSQFEEDEYEYEDDEEYQDEDDEGEINVDDSVVMQGRTLFPNLSSSSSSSSLLESTADTSELTRPTVLRQQQYRVVHFCFLVHGHRGMSRDLSYVQATMNRLASQHQRRTQRRRKQQRWRKQQQQQRTTASQTSPSSRHFVDHDDDDDNDEEDVAVFVVHSATCNEHKTVDGIQAGGERLVEEMLQVMRAHVEQRQQSSDSTPIRYVTVSMLGNSLGGIYSRYAVAKLADRCQQPQQESSIGPLKSPISDMHMYLDGTIPLYFNVFCTTATPHLGVAGHTFLPLPRTAEIGVAVAMGNTGRDLFRLNDMLQDMALRPQYLKPLAAFTKRVAYANAYGTDFPVPVHTAAFLSPSSDYPHHFESDDNNSNSNQVDNSSTTINLTLRRRRNGNGTTAATSANQDQADFVVATLHTQPDPRRLMMMQDDDESNDRHESNEAIQSTENNNMDEQEQTLLRMSSSLDALGWKKVFVDVRKEVPKIPLPTALLPLARRRKRNKNPSVAVRATKSNSDGSDDDDDDGGTTTTAAASDNNSKSRHRPCINSSKSTRLHVLKSQGVIRSRDLAAAVGVPPPFWGGLLTPLTSVNSSKRSSSENSNLLDNMKHDGMTDQGRSNMDVVAIDGSANDEGDDDDDDDAHRGVFHWPLGHNMIVAFSRTRWSAYMNKAGRPVVDALAREMVHDIFSWRAPSSSLLLSSLKSCDDGDDDDDVALELEGEDAASFSDSVMTSAAAAAAAGPST